MSGENWANRPNFSVGDAVIVDDREALGHCRSPFYLRGKSGTICGIHGPFRDPETLAYYKPGLPARVLYKVRFHQSAVWPDYPGPATDMLEADIYEHWLKASENKE